MSDKIFAWVVEYEIDFVCVMPEAFTLSIWYRTSLTGSIGGLHTMYTTDGIDWTVITILRCFRIIPQGVFVWQLASRGLFKTSRSLTLNTYQTVVPCEDVSWRRALLLSDLRDYLHRHWSVCHHRCLGSRAIAQKRPMSRVDQQGSLNSLRTKTYRLEQII